MFPKQNLELAGWVGCLQAAFQQRAEQLEALHPPAVEPEIVDQVASPQELPRLRWWRRVLLAE